jgi:hypothetical protein
MTDRKLYEEVIEEGKVTSDTFTDAFRRRVKGLKRGL